MSKKSTAKNLILPVVLGTWMAIMFNSCSNDGPDDIPCPTLNEATLSYETEIRDIINSNCANSSCHGGTQAPTLLSYSQVFANLSAIERRALIDRTMPPSGPLSRCASEKLAKWIELGAPEFPGDTSANPSDCDTIDLSYDTHIQAIINGNCATSSCHGGSIAPNLSDYSKVYANRRAIDSMVYVAMEMPPSGELSDCQYQQLKIWLEQGAPEFPGDNPGGAMDCDTSVVIAYTGEVRKIIEENCATSSCHLDGNRLPYLNDYASVFTNRFKILETAVYSNRMPKGSAVLDSCSKEVLRKWIEEFDGIESEGDPSPTCDTTEVTYFGDLQIIFNSSCAVGACHDGSQSVIDSEFRDLRSYSSFQAMDQNDLQEIVSLINETDLDKIMPRNGRGVLDDCTKARIEKWIEKGIPQ